MKKTLFILFLLISQLLGATNYHFSNDGNDDTGNGSIAAPYQTITKLNALWAAGTLNAGDSVVFKAGDTFTGTITVAESGSSGNPIIIGKYWTGDDPVITGFSTVTGWTAYNSNIDYKVIACESNPMVLTIDGTAYSKGRYPNSTWLTIDSHVSNTSITDAALGSSPNWTGGEVVIEKNDWVFDINAITDHTSNTLTYTTNSSYSPSNGNNYFVQNHIDALDQLYEWCYDGDTLFVYFGANDPDDYTVKLSTVDDFALLSDDNYISFDSLHITGYNDFGIRIYSSEGIEIDACTFDYIGNVGIYSPYGMYSDDLIIHDCTFNYIFGSAVYLQTDADNAVISYNTISNIGTYYGLGGNSSSDAYIKYPVREGLTARGDDGIIRKNTIYNIGYNGIRFHGDRTVVDSNFVYDFTTLRDDGGGIYCYTGTGVNKVDEEVNNNIVINGSKGFYADEQSEDIIVDSNTFANCTQGIFIHDAHEITITNNVLYNNSEGMYAVEDNYSPNDSIRNITLKNNLFVAKAATHLIINMASVNDDFTSFFSDADSNYYARPIDDDNVIRRKLWISPYTEAYYTIAGWQSYSSQDANSLGSPIAVADTADIDFYYNATDSPNTETLPYASIDLAGTKYATEYTVKPYYAVVLLKNPNPDSDPPDAPTVTTSTLTWNGVLIASGGGTVSDDGTISARGICWSSTGIPTTADDKTTDGTGAGTFTSAMTGLAEDTIYYVRAYATNEIATSYGTVETYSTFARPVTSGGKPMVSGGQILTVH